ncbi:MAG: hypothetical protein KDK62_07090 [Chlamydiia bacterium]|nr:hypothetical protein [Chlamydiia bacterium]
MSLLFVVLLYFGGLFATSDMPQKIVAKRQSGSWPTDFILEEEDLSLAKVETKFFGPTREYGLYTQGKKLLAKAKHSIFRTATLFEIVSAENEHLGLIEECSDHFNIYNENEELIATSSTNFWETQIILLNPEGEAMGTLSRPLLREHDGWSLSLFDTSEWTMNKAIWLLLPAIHTDRPFWQTFPIFHSQTPKLAK